MSARFLLPIRGFPPVAAALAALWLSACAHGGAGQVVEPAARPDRDAAEAGPSRPAPAVRPFPRLSAVPERPPGRTAAELDRILGELAADRVSAARIAAEIDGSDPPGRRGAAVQFAAGSADLDARALGLVDEIVKSWRRRGGTIRIETQGRAGPPTRAEGHAADRKLLAQRANAVAARLLRGGIPASRIVVEAMTPGAAETGRVEVYLSD